MPAAMRPSAVLHQSRCFLEAQSRLHDRFVARFPQMPAAQKPEHSAAAGAPTGSDMHSGVSHEAARQRLRARFLSKFGEGADISAAAPARPEAAPSARDGVTGQDVEAARLRLRARFLARWPGNGNAQAVEATSPAPGATVSPAQQLWSCGEGLPPFAPWAESPSAGLSQARA